ncbi:MAG: hypothetical protein ACLFUF_08620 [Opitutales bacterium]
MSKKTKPAREPGATIRFSSSKMNRAKEIASANYTSFNGLVEMLVDAAIDFADEEGRLQLPLKLVDARDFERFAAWEAKQQNPGDQNASKQTA